MTKLETVLSLAKHNDITEIWKSGITEHDLALEIGELEGHDRRDLETFSNYRRGNGKAKCFDAHKALARLAAKVENRDMQVRGRTLESICGEEREEEESKPSFRTPVLAVSLREHEQLVTLARALAARMAVHMGDEMPRSLVGMSDAELRSMIAMYRETLSEVERPSRIVQRRAA